MGRADEATAAAVAGAVPLAEHPFDATRRQRYELTRTRGGYALAEEGDELAVATTPQEACDALVARSLRRAVELASLKGWVRLRGALVDLNGSRVLLIGPSGAGKTVLALRLALGGAAFQGDDSVLLHEGSTLAVPCLPMLRPGAEELLAGARRVAAPSFSRRRCGKPRSAGCAGRLHGGCGWPESIMWSCSNAAAGTRSACPAHRRRCCPISPARSPPSRSRGR